MKKFIIIGVITVLVIGGGIAAYLLINNNAAGNENNVASNAETNNATIEQASVEDLLTRNANLKCTYDVEDAGSINSGLAYFSGGKNMYGEFTSTQDSTTTTAYVIRNGNTQYVWMPDSTTGFKSNVSASDKQSQQQMSQQYDPEAKYQFRCVNWDQDDSRFAPPGSVTFTDISEQNRLIQEAMNDASRE